MSAFTGEGTAPFPPTNSDIIRSHEFAEWPDEQLEGKVVEYWSFLSRDDIQPRARELAHQILSRLGFEIDYRSGLYDKDKEDGR